MEENLTPESAYQPAEPETEKTKLPSFGERLLAIFAEPKVVFDYVAKRNDFWLPLIALCVVMIAGSLLALPTNTKAQALIRSAMGAPVSSEDPTALSYVMAAIQAPIGLAISLLLTALIIWVVVLMLTGNASYGKGLSVATWAYYPSALAILLNGIVVAVIKPEIGGMQSYIADSNPVIHYTSLQALFHSDGMILSMMLFSISLFLVWYLWLLHVGVRRAMGGSGTCASILVAIVLALQLGFSALGGFFLARTLNM